MRVASLIASGTEIVCALGQGHLLVGRSHECDYPPSVAAQPALTAPKFPVDGPSAEIDRHVKALVAEALSVYRVDVARLESVRPDVIITQSQCEVCAVSLRDVERALGELAGACPRVVSLSPNALEDVFADIRRVAEALEVPARGEALIERMRERMAAIAEKARGLPGRPAVCCIEWIDPLMAAGNWTPELVAMAGGRSVFGEAGRHAPWMTHAELEARDPEVIVILPCGFDIARARRDLGALASRSEWPGLRAVRAGRVFIADGNQYFNRPGPRLVESLEILAEILHPGEFAFGHRGRGYEPL